MPDINPDSWTQEELLKHLYREFNDFKEDWKSFATSTDKKELSIEAEVKALTKLGNQRHIDMERRIGRLEAKFEAIEAKKKEWYKRKEVFAAIVSTVTAIATIAGQYVWKILK